MKERGEYERKKANERERERENIEMPMVTDIRYRNRPEEVSRFIGDREVTQTEYRALQNRDRQQEEPKPKKQEDLERESRKRGRQDSHRLESALERIEERLNSLEKRFKGDAENPRKTSSEQRRTETMEVEEDSSRPAEIEEESSKPAEVEEETSRPAVSDQRKIKKVVKKRCKFPECEHVFRGRHYVPKRHVRAAHLPWFATVHLKYEDLTALPGLDNLWMELLRLLARYVVNSDDLSLLLEEVLKKRYHSPEHQPDSIGQDDIRLARFLDEQRFHQSPQQILNNPPNCIAAMVSVSVLTQLLEQLSPNQRQEIASHSEGLKARFVERWPKATKLSQEEKEKVTAFAKTARLPVIESCRKVSVTSKNTLQISVARKNVETMTELPVEQMEMIDSHFHFDRMLQHNHQQWSWETPPNEVIDCNTSEAHLQYAATSFCDPECYPRGAQLDHLKQDPRILLTFGLHPKKVNRMDDAKWDQLEQLIQRRGTIGFGEIGLDYTAQLASKEQQQEALIRLMHIPMRQNQVMVLHLRGTRGDPFGVYDDFLKIARKYLKKGTKLHIHSFTGPLEFLKQLHRSGFPYFIVGVNSLAFKRSLQPGTEEAIYSMYKRRVVIESDAPHLSYNNQPNYPHAVYHTALHLSEMWAISLKGVLESTNTAFLQMYEPWLL